MSQKNFNAFAGFIFLVVLIVHLLRVLNGWAVSIDEFEMPMWASWVAIVLAGCLAYHGLRKK